MAEYAKPIPVPTTETRPYWEAARKHVLLLPRCQDCNNTFFYPRLRCPNCFSDRITWVEASGKGQVYTFTIVRRASEPFTKDTPYNVAFVLLEEGVKMLTNIVDCPLDKLQVGMPVEVCFDDVSEEISLPKFRPATAAK